jgi:hypothetical protein
MRRVLCSVLLISWLMLVQAMAQSPFDGTWRLDTSASQPSTYHYDYLLKDGIYHCTTCDPPIEVRADGQDHKITGDPCSDTASVKVVDDRTTEETEKKNGKIVGTLRMVVSADGKTATDDWTESCNAKGDVVAGQDIMSRVAEAPRGAHAISGSWKVSKRLNRSESAVLITLKLEADTFSFADPTDQHYKAKLDGTETPFEGDLSGSVVSVKRIGENTIEETDREDGKVVRVARFVISDDGKTLKISETNKANETRWFVCHKQ